MTSIEIFEIRRQLAQLLSTLETDPPWDDAPENYAHLLGYYQAHVRHAISELTSILMMFRTEGNA